MSYLLDVNILLASRWQTHTDHEAVFKWLNGLPEFYTTPIVELGFLRVSLSPAFSASWHDAHRSLSSLIARPSHRFLPDNVSATDSTETNYKDSTDAHLVRLAERHGLKLATLDDRLMRKPWASQVTFSPIQ
ncbi:MAG: PIN domain-containing protein [Luteolibacter sp.]